MTHNQFIDSQYLVPEDFINHSCSPNIKLDVAKRWFIAIKDIKKNSEITFNYCTTEWDMRGYGTDFLCRCGSPKCYGHVRGFKYLTKEQRRKLKSMLSPFLLEKINDKN